MVNRIVRVGPAGWFDVLRTPPALGRAFIRDEETYGNHRVVVVSHGLWQRYLHFPYRLAGQEWRPSAPTATSVS